MPIKNKPPRASEGGTQRWRPKEAVTIFYHINSGISNKPKVAAALRNGILVKRVRGSIHQLRRPAGWAVDEKILMQAEADGAHTVVVEDIESGKYYVARLSAFWKRGLKIDYGFGLQIVLPLQFWGINSPNSFIQLTLFRE
jgi:hypothetical protein